MYRFGYPAQCKKIGQRPGGIRGAACSRRLRRHRAAAALGAKRGRVADPSLPVPDHLAGLVQRSVLGPAILADEL
jgi:hypothetical protein